MIVRALCVAVRDKQLDVVRLLRERRAREQQEQEEAAKRAAILAEEQFFYDDLIKRSKAVTEHRQAKEFIAELSKRWQAMGELTVRQAAWLSRADSILEKRDPYEGIDFS